jgi:hypothetical protein
MNIYTRMRRSSKRHIVLPLGEGDRARLAEHYWDWYKPAAMAAVYEYGRSEIWVSILDIDGNVLDSDGGWFYQGKGTWEVEGQEYIQEITEDRLVKIYG